MITPTSLEIRQVKLPMRKPFFISSGRIDTRDVIIIRLFDKSGAIGYGEAPVLHAPIYKPDFPASVVAVLKEIIAPIILNKDFATPADLDNTLNFIRGHNFAKAAISMAAYDIFGKNTNQTLQQLVKATRSEFAYSKTVSVYTDVEKTLSEAQEILADHAISILKLKTKPGADVANIEVLVENFPQCGLMIDANASYSYAPETVDLYKRIDAFNLMCIEQPLEHDDLVFHARLQQQIKTPLALDESIETFSHLRQALELGSCKMVNIKIPRVGGLTQALRMYDYCMEKNIPVWVGGMIESPIGTAANIAFASKEGCAYPADFMETFSSLAANDEILVDKPFTIGNGVIKTHFSTPGLGITINDDAVKHYASFEERITL
jgi:O-succinylbenzoate synthase